VVEFFFRDFTISTIVLHSLNGKKFHIFQLCLVVAHNILNEAYDVIVISLNIYYLK